MIRRLGFYLRPMVESAALVVVGSAMWAYDWAYKKMMKR